MTSATEPGTRRRRGAVLRELRSLPTQLLVVCCLFVGVPVAILLTPQQELTVAGQHLAVGARPPSPTLSGPAQLVQVGNTELDIARLRVYGPMRPQLTLGPVQRNADAAAVVDPGTGAQARAAAVATVGNGFLRWYGWGALILLAFTLAATAAFGYGRTLVTLRRQSRAEHRDLTVAEIWHRSASQIRGMTVIAVAASLLAWAACGALAYAGAVHGLRNVRSLTDLVGTYHVSPSPVGPAVSGYLGAVIGDSRASRLGGPLVPGATPDDVACLRSTDSLAAEVGNQLASPVLNLACPGATVTDGLRGPQQQGGRVLPSQVGRLKQAHGLKFVAVAIGPNDLAWGDFLRYCYGVPDCQDRLTLGEFNYRLAAFDTAYGQLLRDLNDLPDRPQIIVVTSYDVFRPDASCPDAHGPPGASGLNPRNIELLSSRNAELNAVLAGGAQKYGFDVATPRLAPLCSTDRDRQDADLQGLNDSHPFHPTGVGMIRMASAVLRAIRPEPDR